MSALFYVNPRSNPELRSLSEIAMLAPFQDPLADYFNKVMGILSHHFSVGYSVLMLRDLQQDHLRVEGLYGIDKQNHPVTCHNQKGIIGKVLESHQPIAIPNLSEEPFYSEMMKTTKGTESIQTPLLCVPLIADGDLIGVINIPSLYGPRAELTEDLEFHSILTAILSPVIKNYHARREEYLAKPSKSKTKSSQLEEFFKERLSEVVGKIDPYVESKARMRLLDDIIAVVEKILIKSALERVDHVQVAAAQLLGINRNTLRKKMKDLKIKSR